MTVEVPSPRGMGTRTRTGQGRGLFVPKYCSVAVLGGTLKTRG